MILFTLIIFLICPILSLPFFFMGLKKDKKHRNLYLLIPAIFIALFSYSYRPTGSEDLYRHHLYTMQYKSSTIEDLGKEIASQPEQLSTIYKFVISKTGDENLLQFFTSMISFYILFYLLSEYSARNREVKGWKLMGICIFVLSGFHFIVITSGIFYTLALEIFSLGIYLDYERRKKISVLLYVIPIFIHTCAVFALLVLILYKILGSKNNLRNVLVVTGLILSIGFLMSIAANFNLPIITELSNLYNSYFNNEEYWADLHTLPVLIMHMSRIVPIFLAYGISKRRSQIGDFSVFIAAAVVVLYFQTTFSIRYIHVAVLCSLPLLFEAAKDKKYGAPFCGSLYLFAIPHFIYQVHQFAGLGYFEDAEKIFVTNLVTMLSEGGA